MHAPDAYKKVKETMDGEKEIPTYLTGFRVSETQKGFNEQDSLMSSEDISLLAFSLTDSSSWPIEQNNKD